MLPINLCKYVTVNVWYAAYFNSGQSRAVTELSYQRFIQDSQSGVFLGSLQGTYWGEKEKKNCNSTLCYEQGDKGSTRKKEKTLLNHAPSASEVTSSLLLTGNRKFTFVWNLWRWAQTIIMNELWKVLLLSSRKQDQWGDAGDLLQPLQMRLVFEFKRGRATAKKQKKKLSPAVFRQSERAKTYTSHQIKLTLLVCLCALIRLQLLTWVCYTFPERKAFWWN